MLFTFLSMILFCTVLSKRNKSSAVTSKDCAKYIPRGINQELYVKYLQDPSVKIVAGVGMAGTGKTVFACDAAIRMLHSGEQNVQKIVLTRPLVSVENENIGFLPGDINSKVSPWLLPILDIFLEYFTQNEINRKIQDGVIEISPLGYMRGRTFKNCIIIADEIQNATPTQLLMVTTRIGLNSKLVITGDINQSDLKGKNGLEHFVNRLKADNAFDDIKMVEFDDGDVERSEVVKHVLKLLKD
jgi:phosphate starvation-inducible protein PhoH and related proteins